MFLSKITDLIKTEAPRKQVYIPNAWLGISESGLSLVSYPDFILNQISELYKHSKNFTIDKKEEWSTKAIIYNVFVRYFSAFDHDQDGQIGENTEDITLNNGGIRETGTFLKTLALLPYLKQLGINTIHLLPITEIGKEGRKGDLGSPYAIKNPFRIDPLLADPIINVSVEDQYKALVEAAHLVGIRVVQEFIFRTASIDSEMTENHPDWFYWIKSSESYAPPSFSDADLDKIKQIPKGKGRHVPPPTAYRSMFAIPPESVDKTLKIASAFADWPPDDLQPPWTDVTYLRLYNYDYQAKNNYNYIAYNTIRYYDPKLAQPENINKPLWEEISRIIPYYQQNFGINGAMIDMGHALPERLKKNIIEKARAIDPLFAFWDENFENKEETKNEGYDAVIGGAWYNITKRNGFKKQMLSLDKELPLPYFGASETHNSPRYGYGNKEKKIASWILFNLLPQAIPFLHNGFELNEMLPVNTGLNFNQKDLDALEGERLALFHKTSLNWTPKSHIIPMIVRLREIRQTYPWIFDGKGLSVLYTDNHKVLGYKKRHDSDELLVLFNTNFHRKEHFKIKYLKRKNWHDLLQDRPIDFRETTDLKAGKVLLMISA